MRKEITGLFLFFLVIFTLISLLTFSIDDPSIFNAAPSEKTVNLFGLLGRGAGMRRSHNGDSHAGQG